MYSPLSYQKRRIILHMEEALRKMEEIAEDVSISETLYSDSASNWLGTMAHVRTNLIRIKSYRHAQSPPRPNGEHRLSHPAFYGTTAPRADDANTPSPLSGLYSSSGPSFPPPDSTPPGGRPPIPPIFSQTPPTTVTWVKPAPA